MAVTKTQLAAVRDTANSATLAVTLSRAITANKPCLAYYFAHATSPTDASTASGGGVTWTKRATAQRGNIRCTVFSADGVASPSGTTVTFDNGQGAGTANDAFIYEIDGSDATPSGWRYIANEAAASTTNVLTLGSAPAAGDYGLAAVAFLATGGISWDAGVEDSDSTHASPSCNSAVNSISSSPPTTLTATGTSANTVGGYVGIIAAGGGSPQTVGAMGALGGASIPAPSINQQVVVATLGGATIPAPLVAQTSVGPMAALGGASIPAPTIVQSGGPQTVGAMSLIGGATVPAPSVTQKVVLAVLGGATIPQPQVNQKVAPALLGGATVPAPTINQKVVVLAALGGASVPAPVITQLVGAVAALGGATIPAPTFLQAQFVGAMGVLGGASVLAPIVSFTIPGEVALDDFATYAAVLLDADVQTVVVSDLSTYGVSLSDS